MVARRAAASARKEKLNGPSNVESKIRIRMGMRIHMQGRKKMANILLIIGIILLVLWLLGLVSSYTLGGFIYVALVIGLILIVVWLVMRFSRRS